MGRSQNPCIDKLKKLLGHFISSHIVNFVEGRRVAYLTPPLPNLGHYRKLGAPIIANFSVQAEVRTGWIEFFCQIKSQNGTFTPKSRGRCQGGGSLGSSNCSFPAHTNTNIKYKYKYKYETCKGTFRNGLPGEVRSCSLPAQTNTNTNNEHKYNI